MKSVSIHDAKTNLSKYIAAAKKGEKIYIGNFAKPEVVLTAVSKTSKKRTFGTAKNKFNPQPDAFAPSTDTAVAKLLLGKD